MIVGARIDFRLIHGQVANLWSNAKQVSRFMVVDDEFCNDDVQKQILRMATPASCRLSVLPVDKAAANILAGKYDAQRLFIVVRKPETYVRLIEAGVKLDEINVGNMTTNDVAKKVNLNVSCDEGDIQAFKKLQDMGVPLIFQLTPFTNPEPFSV